MENQPSLEKTISPFLKLLAALARAGVDFAAVGGVAVCLNDYVRFTNDADIIISEQPENVRRLLSVLREWGEGWARELNAGDFIAQEGSIRVTEDFDLDIFTRMRGRSLEDFRPGLRAFEIENRRIPYMGRADVIHCKKDSWRDKDKLDVLAMQEILKREEAGE